MSTIIESIEKEQIRRVPRFDAGDRVRVHFQVIEGSRTRTQVFEGVVLKRQGSGARETFTVRKQSFGVGVERTFPLHSPKIERLEIAARGDVRRAKLYYLRDRVGKAARVAERRWGITDDLLDTEAEGAIDSEGANQAEAVVEVTEVEGSEADQQGSETVAEPGDGSAAPEAEAEQVAVAEVDAEQGSDASAEADVGGEATAEAGAEAEGDTAEQADQGRPEGGTKGGSAENEASEQGT